MWERWSCPCGATQGLKLAMGVDWSVKIEAWMLVIEWYLIGGMLDSFEVFLLAGQSDSAAFTN